jgi:hypothetical protein
VNKGDGRFQAKRDYAIGEFAYSVAIGDLNHDGKPDIAIANNGEDIASVLLNRGDGTFRAKLDFTTGDFSQSVAIGDLNGDGKPDLATANFGNGGANTVSVLLNTPGLCTVQNVRRETLQTAKRKLTRVNCRVGKIRRAYSKAVKRGRVISQKPKFGAVLRDGGKVNLVVSRGKRGS